MLRGVLCNTLTPPLELKYATQRETASSEDILENVREGAAAPTVPKESRQGAGVRVGTIGDEIVGSGKVAERSARVHGYQLLSNEVKILVTELYGDATTHLSRHAAGFPTS